MKEERLRGRRWCLLCATLMYLCFLSLSLHSSSLAVHVQVPMIPDGMLTWSFIKQCPGKQHQHGQYVRGLKIGTYEGGKVGHVAVGITVLFHG